MTVPTECETRVVLTSWEQSPSGNGDLVDYTSGRANGMGVKNWWDRGHSGGVDVVGGKKWWERRSSGNAGVVGADTWWMCITSSQEWHFSCDLSCQ